MTAQNPATFEPTWYYQPAHSGRPPGGNLSFPDTLQPEPFNRESLDSDYNLWADNLSNGSLFLEDFNSSEVWDGLYLGGNLTRTFFAGPQVHVGVEVQLFSGWGIGVWTGVLVILMVVGVAGNVLVPIVVMRTRDLRSSTNLLLVNLAAADLLVLMVSLPTALTELHSKPETWVLGEHMCKLVPFVEYCVCHASVLTILVISFERYYAICRPLRASYTCTKMRACTCILTIWAAAVFLSCPLLILSKHGFAKYADGSRVPVCITELTTFWACLYINLVTAVFFFIPLVLLILLYLVIGRSLMQDSTSAALQQRKVDLPNMKARKQVVVMLATVTIFFFVSLFPFRVFTLWIVWTPQETIDSIGALKYYCMLYGARALLFANSAVNPILYNLTSTKFREAFLKLLKNDRRQRQLSRQSTFNTTGNSSSNGRSVSSRTISTDVTAIKDVHPRMALIRCGRQASFDDFSTSSRPSMAKYGRQSSFAGTHCFPSSNPPSTVSFSRQNSRENSKDLHKEVENGILSAVEIRRYTEGEKRLSGEGRRLLENERRSFRQIQEEKLGCCRTRTDSLSQRREREKKIVAEMEKLLSKEGDATTNTTVSTISSTSKESETSQGRESRENDQGCCPPKKERQQQQQQQEQIVNPETLAENSREPIEFRGKGAAEPGGVNDSGKTIFFCESLSTKVSVV
ncbi:thyrotropin-releasing hormone receptor-like isoform X1 [Macrobrachium nipponense]|uniref:thyrotropin-releasing hormone receptor-like isoform X1 n=1 Tax=Macrobrachium nipponense TaxID=159736 RepID=UPI0030C8B481